jgi:hypothetical protein
MLQRRADATARKAMRRIQGKWQGRGMYNKINQ